MSYIDQSIMPNETLLYRTKKHYIMFLPSAVWTAGAIFFLFNPNDYVKYAGLVFGALALFFWLGAFLDYSVSEFGITDKRVLMREGFFVKHVNETLLSTLANVSVNQNPLGQILNYGVVIIKTYGGDDDPFMDIPNPNEFKKQLQIQLVANQSKT